MEGEDPSHGVGVAMWHGRGQANAHQGCIWRSSPEGDRASYRTRIALGLDHHRGDLALQVLAIWDAGWPARCTS